MSSLFDVVLVLLIEDEPAIVSLIDLTLKDRPLGWKFSYTLRSVDTLAEARKFIPVGGWDVIILDLGLPDSQGIDTFREVYKLAKCPVVILTGDDDWTLHELALSEGAARSYGKTKLAKCMPMLHDTIKHVIRENKLVTRARDLHASLLGFLRKLQTDCANCGRWRDPATDEWLTPKEILEKYGVNLTSTICSDCAKILYPDLQPGGE